MMNFPDAVNQLRLIYARLWRLSSLFARSGFVNDLSGLITPSQKRTCSFGGRKLLHTAILIDSSISPERDEAGARDDSILCSSGIVQGCMRLGKRARPVGATAPDWLFLSGRRFPRGVKWPDAESKRLVSPSSTGRININLCCEIGRSRLPATTPF
jgi:hypothetical protein